jgi:putative heme iron utilization protein
LRRKGGNGAFRAGGVQESRLLSLLQSAAERSCGRLTPPSDPGTVGVMTTSMQEPASQARAVMRGLDRATLATALPGALAAPGTSDAAAWPYASLVLVALDHDLAPILLISTLAEHSKAIAADPRVSLLFDATAGLAQPLTGARLTVLGHAERASAPHVRQRYLARHPDAAMYAGFGDFHFYRVAIARAHLVAGFGRIQWIGGGDLAAVPPPALVEREADIVAHMNDDHADAVQLYAARLLGRPGEGWRLTGLDAAGCDLRRGGDVARLEFPTPVHDAESARAMLVALVRQARAQPQPA